MFTLFCPSPLTVTSSSVIPMKMWTVLKLTARVLFKTVSHETIPLPGKDDDCLELFADSSV